MTGLMDKAWDAFRKAENFEKMAADPSKSDKLKGTAMRGADRKLNEAVELEAQALAAGEKHA